MDVPEIPKIKAAEHRSHQAWRVKFPLLFTIHALTPLFFIQTVNNLQLHSSCVKRYCRNTDPVISLTIGRYYLDINAALVIDQVPDSIMNHWFFMQHQDVV